MNNIITNNDDLQPENNSDSSSLSGSPNSFSTEKNNKAIEQINNALNQAAQNITTNAANNLENTTNINTQFITDIANKNNLDHITKPLVNIAIQNIPHDTNNNPIVEPSTIWEILDVVMMLANSIKNKKHINGSQAKNIVLRILNALINDFAPNTNGEKDICLGLLKNAFPKAIDFIIKAKKGKFEIESKMFDLTGDDIVDINDLALCTRFCKLFCCPCCCKN